MSEAEYLEGAFEQPSKKANKARKDRLLKLPVLV